MLLKNHSCLGTHVRIKDFKIKKVKNKQTNKKTKGLTRKLKNTLRQMTIKMHIKYMRYSKSSS